LMSFLYNTKEKEQRVRQNLPAEPEAKGTWCFKIVVESLSGFLEYIGRFWFNESVVGYRFNSL
jgi:uncharacterized membrane protein YkgB